MADAVTTHLYDGGNEIEIHITNISDGTGESLITKVDRSALKRGDFIKKLNLREIRWNIQGFTSVRFYWNHTADDNIVVLANSGYDYFDHGIIDPNTSGDVVTGAIGDILLSTAGALSGATYDIKAIFVTVE
jgi:hypothetical protein